MTSDGAGTERAKVRRALPWILAVVIKLWLVDGQRLTAYGTLTIDDQWFVERASFIAHGEWLGPFAFDTLIKQPGYPMFVAAIAKLHLPLLLAHQLVWIAACAAAVGALRRELPGRRTFVAFTVLLFNPMTMNAPLSARADRTAIYPSLIVLLLAGLISLVRASGDHRPIRLGWSAFRVFLVVGAIWLTREEWLLIVPALAAAMLVAAVLAWRNRPTLTPRIVALATIAVIPMAVSVGTLWLQHTNESKYGLAITNVEQTSMSAAIGAMTRVESPVEFAHVPVPSEVRELLYPISPTLRSLRAELEDGIGQRYALPRADSHQDIPGQVFMWAVLDSIDATGQALSATQLDATFRAIADEINSACVAGTLQCDNEHHGIAPQWKWSRVPKLTARTLTALRRTFDLASFTAQPPAGNGSAADRELFSSMSHEPLAPGPDTVFVRWRVRTIGGLRWVYRLGLIALAAVAAVRLQHAWRTRRPPPRAIAVCALLGVLLVTVRAIGLAYLDLTTFPGFSPTYLAPGYAVGLTVLVASALGRQPQPPEPPELTLSTTDRAERAPCDS